MEGICVDKNQSTVLENGKRYFLFPNGPDHYYVSNFNNNKSHFGCFQALYFQLIEKEIWPPEPVPKSISLDHGKIYKANLIWRKPGYKIVELKDYYIRPGETHAEFFKDKDLTKCCGCFPLHWFSNFRSIETESANIEPILEENAPNFVESEPKITKYEQLSLFDL